MYFRSRRFIIDNSGGNHNFLTRNSGVLFTLTQEARKFSESHKDDPAKILRQKILALNARISKTMDPAAELDDPPPATRKFNELEDSPCY